MEAFHTHIALSVSTLPAGLPTLQVREIVTEARQVPTGAQGCPRQTSRAAGHAPLLMPHHQPKPQLAKKQSLQLLSCAQHLTLPHHATLCCRW